MSTEYIILAIIFIHWVADFLLQSDKMALNKSKNWYWLIAHTGVYSTVWFVIGVFLFEPELAAKFALITFAAHTATDAITSRISSHFYKIQDNHNFFVTIGFDQFLHYLQLIITYSYIIGFK